MSPARAAARKRGQHPRPAMLLKRELERRGEITLIQSQVIGVSGQICSSTYEVTGPYPGRFCELEEARRAFHRVVSLPPLATA